MANEKTKHWGPATAHGVTYTLPFFLLTHSPFGLLVICVTHIIIDRFRLARYVVWAKNQLVPKRYRYPFWMADTSGYNVTTPIWLATWLMIIVDNVAHILINYAAIRWM